MKDSRSASQILFGFLPEQTVDVKGGIWKVAKWHANQIVDIDAEALRRALISAASPWEAAGLGGNFRGGLRPADSPTRSLARRCAGALRSRGSLALLTRISGCHR